MESASRAGSDELAAIVDLARTAIAEKTDTRGADVWQRREARQEPMEPGLRESIDAPDQLLIAGRIDDVVVGYAAAHLETLADGGLLAVVTDIFTLVEARSVGVGEAMMDAVLAWAREQGCVGVDGLALPGDRHTKNFFETFGLVARAIIVHRRLE